MHLSLGGQAPVGHVRFMPTMDDESAELRLWGRALRVLRKRADLTQDQAAENYAKLTSQDDFTAQAWGLIEAGKRKYLFSPISQRQLTAAIGSSPEGLAAARGELAARPMESDPVALAPTERFSTAAPQSALLPVRDRVQAGAWLAADDTSQVAPRIYPAVRDPRYPTAEQWLSEVIGDSVNRLGIFEGDLVHCVDAIAVGYFPRTDDLVEVERLRFGGQERELTIKQVEVTPGGVLLWPRSTNARWGAPLSLTAGADDSEEIEVRIRGLVIASIRRFSS